MNINNFMIKNRPPRRKRNPVARTMNTVHRAETHRDVKNDFRRKPKHGWRAEFLQD